MERASFLIMKMKHSVCVHILPLVFSSPITYDKVLMCVRRVFFLFAKKETKGFSVLKYTPLSRYHLVVSPKISIFSLLHPPTIGTILPPRCARALPSMLILLLLCFFISISIAPAHSLFVVIGWWNRGARETLHKQWRLSGDMICLRISSVANLRKQRG